MKSYTITHDYRIHRIEIAVGWGDGRLFSNAYVIQRGNVLVLVDAGCLVPKTWSLFCEASDALGFNLTSLEKIVITHGHVDHYGFARRLSEAFGTKAYIHKDDLEKVTSSRHQTINFLRLSKRFMSELGMVEEEAEEACASMSRFSRYAEPLPLQTCETVIGEDVIPVGGTSLKVLSCPGHSPGHLCLYDEANRLLFTGDHLLPNRISDPVFEPTWGKRKEVWKRFMNSLEDIKKLQVKIVFPGHGEPFRNVPAVVNRSLSYFKKLQRKVIKIMDARKMHSADIIHEIDSSLKGLPLFLKVMEVLGTLEALEEESCVGSYFKRGCLIFKRISPVGWSARNAILSERRRANVT